MVGALRGIRVVAEAGEQAVVWAEQTDAAGEFGNDHASIGGDGDPTWAPKGHLQDGKKIALEVEGLHTTILAVGDQQTRCSAAQVDGDAMRRAELTGDLAGATEAGQVPAFRIETMHIAHAIAIGDEERTARPDGDRSGQEAVFRRVDLGGLGIADGGEDVAVEVGLQDLMTGSVRQVEVFRALLLEQSEAMQTSPEVVAPGVELLAILVEDDHGRSRVAAGEDAAIAADRHATVGDAEILIPRLLIPALIPEERSLLVAYAWPVFRKVLRGAATGERKETKGEEAHGVTVWVMHRDLWFGFLMPLPIFVQVMGPFGLYAEPWDAPIGLGVPIGFLAAALLLLPDLRRMMRPLPLGRLPQAAIGTLCLWVFALGVWSSRIDPISLLHALQWIAPVCLVSYAAVVVQKEERLHALLLGLRRGTACGLGILLILGFAEVFTHGLPDGRIRQNHFLPGMYQLYNYVPVGLTAAGLFCAGWSAQQSSKGSGRLTLSWLGATALMVLWTGARDPALMFLLVAPLPAWWVARGKGLAFLTIGGAALVFSSLWVADGDLLLLNKFQSMFSQDGEFSVREVAGNRAVIMEQYWGLVQRHPLTGTGLLPPWIADPEAGVTAKGAHNYYLDTLAWAGPLALGCVLVLAGSALRHLPHLLRKEAGEPYQQLARAAVGPVAAMLLVSSNLRTPLREPISAMVGFLLLGILLSWAHTARRV